MNKIPLLWYLLHSCSLPYAIYLSIVDVICYCINHSIFILYFHRYLYFQSFKYDIGTTILMSKCFYRKTTFPDTHRHFRLAIEISKTFPIVCGGLEVKKSKKKQTCLNSQLYLFPKILLSTNNYQAPYGR